ncbi:hypothetical protein BKI52_04440 [marine bacterium AO1-C]|nr:hypothetical protein BKI52_04440 [marine bacterium AO1-C]
MKKQLLFITFWIIYPGLTITITHAQVNKVVVHGPIAQQWANQLKSAIYNNVNGADIRYMQPQAIPSNLMQILKQYDWLKVGSIHFRSGKYRNYSNECCQFKVQRYTAQGQALEFEADGNRRNRQAAISDYALGRRYQGYVSVVKINGRNFFKTHYIVKNKQGGIKHEYAYGQIISYSNGLLVYDGTITGKISEINSRSRFRYVFKAVPKFDFYAKAGFSRSQAITYPSMGYSYPKPTLSGGRCNTFLSEAQFNRLAHQLKKGQNYSQRVSVFTGYLQNHCATVSQIIKAASLVTQSSQNRVAFFKKAYDYCYDLANYKYTTYIFDNSKEQPLINALQRYITGRKNGTIGSGNNNTGGGNNNGNSSTGTTGCILSNDGFHEIYDVLQSIGSDANRVTTARILLRQKKCITSTQVKRLIPLFPQTTTRMKFLKAAYTYTSDQANYQTIGAVLANDQERRQLQEIIGKG